MSDLRVTNLRGRTAGSSPTLPDGVVITGVATATSFSGSASVITGVATATSFSGSASGLTDIPSAQLAGALPALDGSALTNLNIPASFNELDAALFN